MGAARKRCKEPCACAVSRDDPQLVVLPIKNVVAIRRPYSLARLDVG